MKAVILAGGKGTRLSSVRKTPKALVKIGGKPVIEHQILLLEKYGIGEIYLLLGHLGERIEKYIKGRKKRTKIHCFFENKPLGTAGALKTLENVVKEDFFVLSGDIMLDMDLKKFMDFHYRKGGVSSIIVHPNDHPFDSDLVEIDEEKRIISLLKRPHPEGIIFRNLSIASAYIFSPKVFKFIPEGIKSDIEKAFFPILLKEKEKMYAYNTPEYIKDMGTPQRLRKVKKDYALGRIKKLNLRNKRKAVFIDRDGVINKEVDQLSNLKDLEIYSFSAKAIRRLNETDYLVIIVTNQPMLAKGFMTNNDLDAVHKKLETEIGLKRGKIDAIYHCPHHPEKGFSGEKQELKIKCNCRKPGIGLFLKAKEDFNIDFKKSYMIGDKTSDIIAGKKAGCKTILVKTGYGGEDKVFNVKPDFISNNLLKALWQIQ